MLAESTKVPQITQFDRHRSILFLQQVAFQRAVTENLAFVSSMQCVFPDMWSTNEEVIKQKTKNKKPYTTWTVSESQVLKK